MDGSSSLQSVTTLNGGNKATEKIVLRILPTLRIMLENSRKGIGRFLGLVKKWYETHVFKPIGEWDYVADIMMLNFSERGHPVFRGSSAFERGDLKSKGKGRSSLHFNGSIEVILRTFISVNQLSTYGAVADMWGEQAWEVSRHSKGTGKPVALENLETMVMPPEMSTTNQTSQTDAREEGNLLREYEQRFADLPEHVQLTKLCSNVGRAKTVEKGQYFTSLDDDQFDRLKRILSRDNLASKWSIISSERMDPWKHEDRSSSGCDGLLSSRTLRCWNQDRIPIWWQDLFLGSDCEWNQQIRNTNVRRDPRRKCWREE